MKQKNYQSTQTKILQYLTILYTFQVGPINRYFASQKLRMEALASTEFTVSSK
jgi:hypothetical protein